MWPECGPDGTGFRGPSWKVLLRRDQMTQVAVTMKLGNIGSRKPSLEKLELPCVAGASRADTARASRCARSRPAARLSMRLTKQQCIELVDQLDKSIPTVQLSTQKVKAAAAILAKVEAALHDVVTLQGLWTHKVLDPLGKWLEVLVAKRLVNDPNEELLYGVCEAFKCLLHNHPNDPRHIVAQHTLGSLATLALNQGAHDGEAVEIGLAVLAALFSGPSSVKQVRNRFFGQGGQEIDETSRSCILLLKNAERALTDAQTHAAQMSLCDTLVCVRKCNARAR